MYNYTWTALTNLLTGLVLKYYSHLDLEDESENRIFVADSDE